MFPSDNYFSPLWKDPFSPLWKDPYRMESVMISYENRYIYIFVGGWVEGKDVLCKLYWHFLMLVWMLCPLMQFSRPQNIRNLCSMPFWRSNYIDILVYFSSMMFQAYCKIFFFKKKENHFWEDKFMMNRAFLTETTRAVLFA